MSDRKEVTLPIFVPDNDHCWDGITACAYFKTTSGHPHCDLDLAPNGLGSDANGVIKSDKCKALRYYIK